MFRRDWKQWNIIKLAPHELTRDGQLLLSSWDLTHASLSSSEQWFAYFIHAYNETRVYIYCINFCQTIMVPFTVCLPPIIFRWKYICDKLLCWTLLPTGWWDLSVHFYVLGRSGLLIFRAVAEPGNSGKSAKSREIHKNAKNTAKFRRNLIRYTLYNLSETYFSYWGYLLAINLQIYLRTSSLKRANNIPKLPGIGYVAKNWALAMMLKALPLVHFWSVLLLKEQMMTSVRKSRGIWLFLPRPVRSPGRSLRLLATVEWQDWFLLLQVTVFVWYSSWTGFLRASG